MLNSLWGIQFPLQAVGSEDVLIAEGGVFAKEM